MWNQISKKVARIANFRQTAHTSRRIFTETSHVLNWIFYGGRPMRLTSKGRYAVRAMLDLTTHSNGNPVRLQEISTRQNISLHYLEQLFRKLRNGQAVKSVSYTHLTLPTIYSV